MNTNTASRKEYYKPETKTTRCDLVECALAIAVISMLTVAVVQAMIGC